MPPWQLKQRGSRKIGDSFPNASMAADCWCSLKGQTGAPSSAWALQHMPSASNVTIPRVTLMRGNILQARPCAHGRPQLREASPSCGALLRMRGGLDSPPSGGALVSVRKAEQAGLSTRAAADLQSDRQARGGEAAGYRDGRQPQHVDGSGVVQHLQFPRDRKSVV